ncbi:MAG TPA: AsmA family protein [Bradyrhizobium sp.]|uniref:AsmA family protein n=1 Tax=Bradyrhizobium sp. TaxID=376 RepID=UPI002B5AF877|nr:AsmA family protein [Bradyrhizobium sp.]HLZ04794.1 AsmA family protein [Bradyrhizobium sp.]
MKAVKITGATIAAVVLVVALLLVIGIPSGFLTSAIQDHVERQTGYRLTIAGSTKISLWPTLNISLGDLTLQDPKDRDGASRVTVAKVQADMTLSSVWSGHPHVSELVITKPVVYRPLLRERTLDAPPRATKSTTESEAVTVDRVKIIDGAIIASNTRDRFEHRIEGINVYATIEGDRKVKLAGTARTNDSPLKFDANATLPPAEHEPVPVEFNVEAPDLLSAPLSAKAEVRFSGPAVKINSVTGTLGGGTFNGWASVEAGSKPLVKVDLDFQRLEFAGTKTGSTSSASQGWSDAPLNLTGLNYVDAQVRLSASELDIGGTQFAPAGVDATLAGGVLKASFSNLGAYGGQASGEVIVDASSGAPTYAMHTDLVGVRALPLLTSLAGFDKIDGKMQAKIAARSAGASQHAIMANMSGTAFLDFQDGQIRGVNVAQMIRSLTASTLNGWQEQQQQATDMTQLSASFKIDRGQAVTTDLSLVGPLVRVTGVGTIDLGTQMIGFRVEPKLVMTTEGQGSTADPVGFGIPVMLEGPWSQPRIYPDMQGVLDNPDAAYAKLREMGKGLFSSNGGGLGGILGGLSALTGNPPGNNANNGTPGSTSNDPLGGALGGNIGQALGNLFGNGVKGQNRSIPSPDTPQAAPQAQEQSQTQPPPPAADSTQDSQPMNDVLRQLFNR